MYSDVDPVESSAPCVNYTDMPKHQPTIYLDTNIPSIIHYRGSNLATRHQQIVTQEWWDSERHWFRIYASVFTEGELAQGSYRGQARALRLARRLPYLPFTAAVRQCAQVYLDERLIPATRQGDAIQLAFATVHEIDYLLTWNYAHLANLDTQRRLKGIHRQLGWRSPLLVSPESIPRRSLGQTIVRKENAEGD